MPLLRSMIVGASLLALVVQKPGVEGSFSPHPDIGYPAGLIPECPGVMKNASISAGTMSQLQVVMQKLSTDGRLISKSLPVMAAAKLLAKDRNVDLRLKTVLHAVGFFDSSLFPHSQAVATAYLRRGYNVFVSETFSLLTRIYPKSVRLTRVIGKKIGEFLVKLTEQGLSPDNIELVGISLGAHIVSYAAKYYFAKTGRKVSRLTGLDPAGPCFRAIAPELRLNSDDAERVDVLHTNIDGFGIAEPLGHIDFYVNGGEFQPGDIPAIPCLVVCSHLRSVLYWWQALEHPKKFIGVKCESVQDARLAKCYNNSELNYVGLETKFDRQGIYYLPTNYGFPYYRGKEGLKPENEIYTSVVRDINSDNGFTV